MQKNGTNEQVFFSNPFSLAYWRQAARELKSTKMLVFAAIMIALRVALKPIGINIGPTLRINTAFIANAVGAMVMGPVMALLCGAVTDTLGCLLFPSGPYFFPFIFVEMLSSMVFALFLYRTELKAWKVIMSRFCICFFVNVVIQTPIMLWYYSIFYTSSTYAIFDLPRIAKNLIAFPLESLVLMLILPLVIPALKRSGFVVSDPKEIRVSKKIVAVTLALAILGAGAVTAFYVYDCRNNSLSAGYTAEERYARNEALRQMVQEKHPELPDDKTVCIIEAAYQQPFSAAVTYQVAVYEADPSGAEDPEALLRELRGLSKSKAAKREEMTRLMDEEIQVTDHGAEPEKIAGKSE